MPFAYDVTFTRDALAPDNGALLEAFTRGDPGRRHRVLPVVDAGLAAAWPELSGWVTAYFTRHAEHLELVALPEAVVGGEAAKNDPRVVERLHALFHEHHMDRHSFVLVLGGGAVQDAAGFAAATAHRGLRTVRMPTTVLAQNDSGVGVKNGVNRFGAKNFVGTFAPPFAVVNDARFLERLPARDRIAGLAEAVKVALIRDARSSKRSSARPERSPRSISTPPRRSCGAARPFTCGTSRRAAIPSSSAARGRSTSGTGPRTSSSR